MIKVFGLLKRKDGLTQEEFLRHWEEKHGPLVAEIISTAKRYVQNHAISLGEGGESPFDGVCEFWFDDLESWRVAVDVYKGEEGKPIRDDEEEFLDKSKLVFFVVEEKIMKQ